MEQLSLSELLLQGKTPDEILAMEKLELPDIKLNTDESSFPFYYLNVF